jgi:uncharacterized membrane protein
VIRLAAACAVALSTTLVLGMQASDPPLIADLGTLGHDVAVATAINNKMQVVGWMADNFEPFRAPFLWERGVMRELTGPPDLRLGDALDIDDRGRIVGFATDVATFALVAVVWEDGGVTRLPLPPGDRDCVGESINEQGDVLGSCATPDGAGVRFHAVLWRDGRIVDLAPLSTSGDTAPIALSDRGVVLGSFRTSEGLSSGNFVWTDGALTRLPPELFAVDLDDRGQIAGALRPSAGAGFRPVIFDRGTFVPLPPIADGVACWAATIDQRANVGGWCGLAAVVWVRGHPFPLPGLSEFATSVTDLNDRGDAVGYSTTPEGNAHAVLWAGATKRPPRQVAR